jgi:TusA-related sulfurtransferase
MENNIKILDLRGFITPFTLLKVSNTFKEMPMGETVEVLWGSSEVSSDLFKILPDLSFEVIVMEERHGEEGQYYRAQLRKAGTSAEN